jgi:hypothetical protein
VVFHLHRHEQCGSSSTVRIGYAPTNKFYGCNDVAEIIIFPRESLYGHRLQ